MHNEKVHSWAEKAAQDFVAAILHHDTRLGASTIVLAQYLLKLVRLIQSVAAPALAATAKPHDVHQWLADVAARLSPFLVLSAPLQQQLPSTAKKQKSKPKEERAVSYPTQTFALAQRLLLGPA